MKRGHVVLGFGIGALAALVLAGCGGDEHPPIVEDTGEAPFDPPDLPSRPQAEGGGPESDESPVEAGGESPSSADGGGNDTPSVSSDGGGVPLEVSVEMLTPTDETEPTEVFDDSLRVSCRIVGAPPDAGVGQDHQLDPSSIVFELLTGDGELLTSMEGARSEDDRDVYEATFPVVNLESGVVVARCAASDASTEPEPVEDTASTFIDHGPEIEIITPEPGSPESVLGPVAFEYRVEADELIDDDEPAAIVEVWLALFDREFELVERDDEPGVYFTTIDFQDTELFKEAPTGAIQIAVNASNERGITRIQDYEFILDGAGPGVTINAPENGLTIGGKVTLTITALDDISAVDWQTLTVSLNDVPYPYEEGGPWGVNGDVATFTFETREVEGSIEQINVNVLVSDHAGNQSPGASALYYRDELPPRISMNPPNFRATFLNGNTLECSVPFDPLGDAVADGDRVNDLGMYRALVWDETNMATNTDVGHVLHPAYANRDSVDLFVRKPDEALVIDTDDDDDYCDDIREEGTRFQSLTALPPQGLAYYRAESEQYPATALPAVNTEECVLKDVDEPVGLCAEAISDLTIVVAHALGKTEPLVYAVKPTPQGTYECTGTAWELPSAGLSEYQGWVCLAVRALDNVGNRSVSAPIAVCLDNSQVDGAPDCWLSDVGKPTCSDGCTPAPELAPQFVRQ